MNKNAGTIYDVRKIVKKTNKYQEYGNLTSSRIPLFSASNIGACVSSSAIIVFSRKH
jgi:hypothetical protein